MSSLSDSQRTLAGGDPSAFSREPTDFPDPQTPDGFTDHHDADIWNVGHVFRWSEFSECYLCLSHFISVKPGETGREAYERETGEPLFDKHVFYVAERTPSDWRTR
jgi:hypothetical protein